MELEHHLNPPLLKHAYSLFHQTWWVILFALLCFYGYEKGFERIKSEYALLHEKYENLHNDRDKALSYQEELRLHLNSQNNPEWIELTLMKELGLIPQGQTKVIFKQS